MYKYFSSDYFNRNRTESLKGFLALAVLFHHLYQKTQIVEHSTFFGFFLQSLGYYCVSIFFFISGYGLLMSFNRGGVFTNISTKQSFAYINNQCFVGFCICTPKRTVRHRGYLGQYLSIFDLWWRHC